MSQIFFFKRMKPSDAFTTSTPLTIAYIGIIGSAVHFAMISAMGKFTSSTKPQS